MRYADLVLGWAHTALWYYNNVVWTDLCSSIIPLSEKKATELALARKGKKGWLSPGSEMENQNLAGKRESLKQKSWGTMGIWWFPVLCKGKLHVYYFGRNFPGEKPAGARLLVEKVRSAVNVRFQNDEYGRRLKRCCDEVNKKYDVEGLCQGYPKRMKLLQQKQGGRLKK